MKLKLPFFRTANGSEMRLSAAICTANIGTVADGEWALIAPYGDHASPNGEYTQHFDRAQADKVVKTWNSIAGTAARYMKNAMHRLGLRGSSPVWDGHPETDKQRWPKEKLLAEITDIRAGDDGLEGRVTWNAKGIAARTKGPLYPSPLWWHWPPSGEPPTVFPELLESIGLVPTPNISSVPAWTQNATLDPESESHAENENMNEEQLKALRKALGLPDTADFQTCIGVAQTATANAALLTERDTALTTANASLSTANASVTTLTTERDTLKTANTALTAEKGVLVAGILNIAEKRGAITPAQRADFETRLTTANTAAAALTVLETSKAMNTQSVEINGNRVDLTTANARQTALNNAVAKYQGDHKCDYDTAFSAIRSDPNFASLFGAMQDPTVKSA